VNRVNMEDSIPYRHWHLNDPGVVPNVLQTGAGSPTGMIVYEGTLLPEKFRNQMIHCEPGQNVVRAYPVSPSGAGYTATIENILSGEKDQWFRPSDICVAPDGSLIVADWYDPVVGGHDARDKESGRIYRIAPRGSSYKMPSFDYNSPEGAVKALQNPNLVVRRKAWDGIQKMGKVAVTPLEALWKSSAENRMRARAFWALVKLPDGNKYIEDAAKESDPNLRVAAIRAARQLNSNVLALVGKLLNDKDAHVRRECVLALHENRSPEAAQLWVNLASQYDGKDRWYLEALGIGAANQWDNFFDAYVARYPDPLQTQQGRDIVWRARTDKTLTYLVKLATDETTNFNSRLRYFRAFDFDTSVQKTQILLQMLADNKKNDVELNAVLLQGLSVKDVQRSAAARKALNDVVRSQYGTKTYLDLIERFDLKQESERLVKMALEKQDDELAPRAVNLVIRFKRANLLSSIANGNDSTKKVALLNAMSNAGDYDGMRIIQGVAISKKNSDSVRAHALRSLGRSWGGGDMILELIKSDRIPRHLFPAAIEGIDGGPQKNLVIDARNHMSNAASTRREPFDRDAVLAMRGSASNGATIFKTNCSICHQVRGEGTDFGPKLSEIGTKLPKDALLDAIIDPSSGISFGYETTELIMKDGSTVKGLVSEKSPTEIGIKLPGGTVKKVKATDVKLIKVVPESMMPDLHETMNKQQTADLIAYLSSLRKK